MAFSAKIGTFASGTGTSNIAVTGVGFQPVVVLFFGPAKIGGAHNRVCYGAATAATERGCVGVYQADGVATTDTSCVVRDDACFYTFATSGGVDLQLDFVSMDADGFTVVPDDAAAADTTIVYVALGGADLTNAKVTTHQVALATGSSGYTGVGFQPDCQIYFVGSLGASTINTIANSGALGMGWADGTSQVGVNAQSRDNVGTSETRHWISTSHCVITTQTSSDADGVALSWVSFDADGMTLSKDALTAQPHFVAVSLKGLQKKAGTTAMRTDTNNQVVTGVGFTPKLLLLLGAPDETATQANPTAQAEQMVGGADGTSQFAIWWSDEDGLVGNTDNYLNQSTTRCATNFDVATGATDQGDMAFSAFGSDGFTLDQDTAGVAAVLLPYLAFGDAAAGGGSVVGTSDQIRNALMRRRRR